MESNRINLLYDRKFQVGITIVMMLISLYLPYQRNLTYVYQVVFIVLVCFLCGASSYAIIPLLILSTTRSYIAVSVQFEFAGYLGINGNIMFVTMLLLLFLVLKKLDFKLNVKNEIGSLILLAFLFLASRIWAANTAEYGMYYNAICLIYITIPFLIENEEDILVSKWAFVLAGFFAGIGIIPHILTFGTIYEFSVSVDRNYQSCFLLLCILQTVSLLVHEWKNWIWFYKIACLIVIVLDLYIIITSASRSAFIAIGIAVAVYLMFNLNHYKKFFSALIIGGIAIAYLYEIGMFDFVLERFTLANVATANGRFDIWADYLNGFMQGNPFQVLFGHGLVGQTDFGIAAHNIFISILYSFGIVGFLLLFTIIVLCIVNFVRSNEYQELLSFIPILFMCCTLEPYYRLEFAIYLAIMVGNSKFYSFRGLNENEDNYKVV